MVENHPDDICLTWLFHDVLLLVLLITVKLAPPPFAHLVTLADAPFQVFGNGPAFLLRKCRKDGQQHLAHCLGSVDPFLLEDDVDALFLQVTDVLEALHRVSGKPGDALGHNGVELTSLRVADHLEELRTLSCGSARDAFIGVHVYQHHVWVLIDLLLVRFHLGFQ